MIFGQRRFRLGRQSLLADAHFGHVRGEPKLNGHWVRLQGGELLKIMPGTREFSQQADRSVTSFLARFDAIFTLNQDQLLEHFYWPELYRLDVQHGWDYSYQRLSG